MRVPDKFAQTYKELVGSLRREAKDNLKMADLKKPIAMRLGDRYALIAEVESNVADRVVAMWRREHKSAKTLRNCDVGTPREQNNRFVSFCASHYRGAEAMKIDDGPCDCPCWVKGQGCNCFVWGQMPYVEKKRRKREPTATTKRKGLKCTK